jgi:cation transport regulator ChaB
MTENEKDILNKAIDELKGQRAAGPPKEVVDETMAQLAQAGAASPLLAGRPGIGNRIWPIARLAAAAAILVFVGFSIGTAARNEPLDLAQLHDVLAPSIAASLEPAIRDKLAEEMTQHYQLALANTYHRVKDELTQQHRDDMNRLAVQTLAASNAVTNRLLADLMDTIKTEQTRDLRSVAAALQRIDRKRIEDKEVFSINLEALAHQTEAQWRQTKGELVQLLVETQPPGEAVNDPNERNWK